MKTLAVLSFALLLAASAFAAPKNTPSATPNPAQMEALMIPKKVSLDDKALALSGAYLFIVETEVEGVPAKMLVDTGASHTTLDLNWVRKHFPNAQVQLVSVGGGGSPYGFAQNSLPLMPLKKFSVGKNQFFDFWVPLVDLRGLQAALPELKEVVGVLGMNTLGAAPCRISFKTRSMQWLSKAALAKIGKKEKLQTSLRSGSPCFMVHAHSPKDGKPLPLLLDCGAVVSCVPESFWTAARPEKQMSRITTAAGVRDVEIAFGVPAELKLSSACVLKNLSPQLIPSGAAPKYLLGADALSQTDLLIDAEKKSVFALPNQ